jgi:hypothetical protein
MFLVLLMIFHPAGGWQRAAESGRSVARITLLHLMPMLLLGCVAEGAGMMRWGKRITQFGRLKTYALPDVLRFEVCHFAAGLVLVFAGAVILKSLGNTFHSRQKFVQAFTAAAFGLGPIFLLRVCDAFPAIPPLVSWAIGAVLTISVLYQGLPRVMKLDPGLAAGVYISSVILLVLASGIERGFMVYFVERKLLGTVLSL